MKAAVVIIISIIIVVLGIIVGITLLFGRGNKKDQVSTDSGSSLISFGVKRGTADGGILVSEDAGISWSPRVRFGDRATIGGVDINDIVFDPTSPHTNTLVVGASSTRVLLGTTANGLLASTTGTRDWMRVTDEKNVLLNNATVYKIAFDPHEPMYVYVAVSQEDIGRLLRSGDGGKSFEEVYQTPKTKSAVYTVAVDPDEPKRVYIGTAEGGLLVSENRGASWKTLKWFTSPVRRLYIHPQDADFMYATFLGKDLAKVSRSHDHGQTWEELNVLPKNQLVSAVYDLAFHPTDANVLFLATSAGMFKTPDAGATWQEFPLIIPPALLPVYAVAVDPRNTDNIYVAASSQLYKSRDGGATWEVHKLPTMKNIRILVFSPDSSDVLFAGMRK